MQDLLYFGKMQETVPGFLSSRIAATKAQQSSKQSQLPLNPYQNLPLCLQYGYFGNTHSIKPAKVTKCSPSFSQYQNCPIPPF